MSQSFAYGKPLNGFAKFFLKYFLVNDNLLTVMIFFFLLLILTLDFA